MCPVGDGKTKDILCSQEPLPHESVFQTIFAETYSEKYFLHCKSNAKVANVMFTLLPLKGTQAFSTVFYLALKINAS